MQIHPNRIRNNQPGSQKTRLWYVALLYGLFALALLPAACTAGPVATPQPTPMPTAQPARPGAAGLGDPIFPGAGNGGYDAQHYLLDLAVNVEQNFLTGTVTISAEATKPLSSFNLDFAGFTVDSLAVNGQEAAYERAGRELTIRPDRPLTAGEPFTTVVGYHGSPASTDAWRQAENAIFVAGEPVGAATWYPANDHPLDKATYTFRVATRRPYMAVANGSLVDILEAGEAVTYIWEMAHPMASYLSTVYVGELALQGGEDLPGVPIKNYLPPRLAQEAGPLFAAQDEMLAFFADSFGPYPFESYGAALVDVQWGGALETQSLSLFGRNVLLHDLPDGVEMPPESAPQTVIAHELAHQWFGDSVSLESWQDIWLKEGAATYASWLWLAHDEGEAVLADIVARRYATVAEAIGGDLFTFGQNPTPFDPLSGTETMAIVRALDPAALVDQVKLSEALSPEMLPPAGEADAPVPANLANAHIEQMIALLPEGPLSGEQVMEILETLPGEQMSGRQVFQALVLLQIYNVAGMSMFQGARIAPPATPTADTLYSLSTYDRGALALHALRLEVGDETWFQIMQDYYERYQFGNAGTDDFIEVAEAVSGQDLGDFFDGWLYDQQMPPIPELGLAPVAAD